MQAILFDLDGVLTDSHDYHFLAWRSWARDFDLKIDEYFFKETFGQRNDEIITTLLGPLDQDKQRELGELKETYFRKAAQGKIQLFEGIPELLHQLKQNSIPMIVASSTPRSNMLFFMRELHLDQYMDQFVCGDDVKHGKPAPDPFLLAAKRLNISAQDCCVVEDALAGIEAAKAAGCFCIALATTQTRKALQQQARADAILNTPKELITYFVENKLIPEV